MQTQGELFPGQAVGDQDGGGGPRYDMDTNQRLKYSFHLSAGLEGPDPCSAEQKLSLVVLWQQSSSTSWCFSLGWAEKHKLGSWVWQRSSPIRNSPLVGRMHMNLLSTKPKRRREN